jgi:ADP-ribosylglycohydrolase
VALYFAHDDPGPMFDAVLAASLMTHRDVRSLAGALAVAHAVRRLANGGDRDPSFLLWLAADVARDEDRIATLYPREVVSLGNHRRSLSRAIAHAESVLELPRERALAALVEEANRHGADPLCKRPTMGFPPACIPTCLYLLLATDSFEEALIDVVNLGGDADSAGAILGALAGSHYGIGSIPDRWLARLRNREAIDIRARALARRSAEGLTIPDLVEGEHELSAMENACREGLLAHPQNGGDLGANRLL